MVGLRLHGIKKSEHLELVRSVPNFLRDEFLVFVHRLIHGDDMIWHLGLSVSMANKLEKVVKDPDKWLPYATAVIHNDFWFHLIATCSELCAVTVRCTSTVPTCIISHVLGVHRLHSAILDPKMKLVNCDLGVLVLVSV